MTLPLLLAWPLTGALILTMWAAIGGRIDHQNTFPAKKETGAVQQDRGSKHDGGRL